MSERGIPYAGSALLVGVASLVAWGVSAAAPLPHVSVILLCAVLASAVRWGYGPALFAAVSSVAVASFFFYAPIYSFGVASPQDGLDLVVFSVAALLTSALANELRRRRIAAERHDAMMAELYKFSRGLAAIADLDELLRAIVASISGIVGREVALILPRGGRTVVVGDAAKDAAVDTLLTAAGRYWTANGDGAGEREGETKPRMIGDRVGEWELRPLRRGARLIALLAVPDTDPAGGRAELLDALMDQTAVAIERAQLAAAIEDTRLKAKTEELREALLNSLSHDLQTPLAAIIGSATSLQSFGTLDEGTAEAELVATIREEGERLHHFIGNVLDLTRIRSGEIHPHLEIVELADIVNAALRKAARVLAAHEVAISLPADLPMLSLDLFLMEQALVNLLENAAKYSPPGARIDVTARLEGSQLVLEVRDEGVGIGPEDLPNVFGQWYRVERGDSKPAGSGLGLSICRAFVEAQGGSIEARSAGTGRGSAFRIKLPVADDPTSRLTLPDE